MSNEKKYSLSIIIPFFNELKRIERNVQTLTHYLQTQAKEQEVTSIEVIYVDDGSIDDSTNQLKTALSKAHTNTEADVTFCFLRLPHNQGKGAAIREGVLSAKGKKILYTDFDLSISLKEIELFNRVFKTFPQEIGIVIASRRSPLSILRGRSWIRRIVGTLFHRTLRLILKTPVKDTQCGFKMFDHDSAKTLFTELKIKRFAFDVEILKKASDLGIPIYEAAIEVDFDDRHSTINLFRDPIKMLWDIIRFRLSF